jgi:hypothetical protein
MEVFLTVSLTFKDNAFWTFKFPLPEICFTKMLVTVVLIEMETLPCTNRKLSKGLWFGMPHIIQYSIFTFWPEYWNLIWGHEMLPLTVLIWHGITCTRDEQEFLITYKHGIQICPLYKQAVNIYSNKLWHSLLMWEQLSCSLTNLKNIQYLI